MEEAFIIVKACRHWKPQKLSLAMTTSVQSYSMLISYFHKKCRDCFVVPSRNDERKVQECDATEAR